jgi:hypothetical protein
MVTRRDFYHDLIDDAARDPSLSLETMFKTLLLDVDARIVEQEERVLEIEKIKSTILQTVLEYNQQALEPEFARIRELADLGLLFEGHSSTELTISMGQKVLVIDEEDRERFTPTGFVGLIRTGDPGHAMTGARADYDRESGALTINVERLLGDGTYDDWTVVATSATDNAQAAVDAETHAAGALTSKTEAQAARDAALGYRDGALSAKSAAEVARDAALAAQTAAEVAEAAAEGYSTGIDEFVRRYQGPAAANPTTREDLSALVEGDLYWNTVANEMRVWDGAAWVVAYVPSGSDVTAWNSRIGAVLPQDADYTASQVVVSPTVSGQSRVQAALTALKTEVDGKMILSALPAFVQSLLDDADAATARATLGLAAVAASGSATDLTTGLLPNAILPNRLREYKSVETLITDWNVATRCGWHASAPGAANAPANAYLIGQTLGWDDTLWTIQIVYEFTTTSPAGDSYCWMRTRSNTTWTAWARVRMTQAELDARYAALAHTHSVATSGASGFMSNTDKIKLDGVESGANAYAHPTGDGNLHVPATSTTNNGKVLKAGATAGSAAWSTVAYGELTGIPTALSVVGGLTPAADRIAYYTGAGSAALATLSAFARTILDDADAATVRATISAADAGHTHSAATTGTAGFMSAADKGKLDGVATSANNYVHPTGDGNLHVPANGTGNTNKVLKASGTAGSYSWGMVDWGEISNIPAAVSTIGGLTPAADRVPYYTGAGAAALAPFSAYGRSLVDDADAATARATLGLGSAALLADTDAKWRYDLATWTYSSTVGSVTTANLPECSEYLVEIDGVSPTGSGTNLALRVAMVGGSVLSTGYNTTSTNMPTGTAVAVDAVSATSHIVLSKNIAAGRQYFGVVRITGASGPGRASFTAIIVADDGSICIGGGLAPAGTIERISLVMNGANIDAGSMRIHGKV